MGRIRKNLLTVRPLAGGLFRLSGYCDGKRVRMQSADIGALEAKKLELEAASKKITDHTHTFRLTWLTVEQLREAEAATERAGARGLLACVEASDRVMVTGEPVTLATAWTEWKAHLIERGRYTRTMDNNRSRVDAFRRYLATMKAEHVGDVMPEHFERFIFRGERADYTRTNDAAVLRAWARYWVRRRWVKESPFEVDFKDLKSRARSAELPRILTPAQARALLAAATAHSDGALAPYVALSCWCFLRHAEALRVMPADLRLDGKQPVVEIRPRKRGTVSYRTVNVPACVLPILKAAKESATAGQPVAPWGVVRWNAIRAAAGLGTLGPVRNKKRSFTSAVWQENILRHTGISYHHQQNGDMKETCRQAGNSSDTSFRHYLALPEEGASQAFYAVN